MKLAILNYMFMFDPTDTGWTSGSKFESSFVDYWAAFGYEAEVIETAGSGVKAIMIRKIDSLNQVKDMKNQQVSLKPQDTLKQMQPDAPTKSFKTFVNTNNSSKQPQKLNYKLGGRVNAKKVYKTSVKFRGGK